MDPLRTPHGKESVNKEGDTQCRKSKVGSFSTARPLEGTLTRECPQRGAGNTALRRLQFEDRLRREPPQGMSLSSLLVVGKLLHGAPSTVTFPPSLAPQTLGAQREVRNNTPSKEVGL